MLNGVSLEQSGPDYNLGLKLNKLNGRWVKPGEIKEQGPQTVVTLRFTAHA